MKSPKGEMEKMLGEMKTEIAEDGEMFAVFVA